MLEILAFFTFLPYMISPGTIFTHLFGGALPRKITHRKKDIYSEDRCSVYFNYIDNSLSDYLVSKPVGQKCKGLKLLYSAVIFFTDFS